MNRLLLPFFLLTCFPSWAFAQDRGTYSYPTSAWSPYLVGGLIGVLVMVTLSVSKKAVGASSAYASLAGILGRLVSPGHIRSLPYYQDNKPGLDWTMMFVGGAILGAFLAAWSGGELTGSFLQSLWIAEFGPNSIALRTIIAFSGGILLAYGARLAGGCTSGHGISGTLQLAVSSWITVLCFFAGGAATAMMIYRL